MVDQGPITITFHGRAEGIEEVRWPGLDRVVRRPCGVFVDAYTIGTPPVGLPAELWRAPGVDFQIVLDLWLAEPDRRSVLSFAGSADRVPADAISVRTALSRQVPHERIAYRTDFVHLDGDDKRLETLVAAWAQACRVPRPRRHSAPPATAWPDALAEWTRDQVVQHMQLDPATILLTRLSPAERRRANDARRELVTYLRKQQRLRWAMVAIALDAEAAAWAEILHALRTGASARACLFCSRYFIRPAGYKRDCCRSCTPVLRRAWRKRRRLLAYPRGARAVVAPVFWARPQWAAPHGIELLDGAANALKRAKWEGGRS